MTTYKNKVYEIADTIGNAKHDGLYGFDKTKPFYCFLYKDISGYKRPIFKYFKTEAEAVIFRDKIKAELIQGLYNAIQ